MEQREQQQATEKKPKKSLKNWLKGMGIGAFAFFFIKGLVWLAIFFGLFELISC